MTKFMINNRTDALVADEEMGRKWKKTGSRKSVKKMAAVFRTAMRVMIVLVEQVGFLCLFAP